MTPVTSLLSAITSLTLSVSLTLGSTLASTLAFGAPADGTVDTGATEREKDEAEKLVEQAIDQFSAKNFTGAVELFQKAYEIDPQPNYLFNIGRVYEEAGEFEQAVEYYAKFVKQPSVDLQFREDALERLRVLRAILAETKDEAREGPKEEPKQADPGPGAQPVDADAQRKRKAMRLSGFGVLGVGAGALIGAAVVGSLAQGDRDKAFDRDEADHLAARQYYLDKSRSKAMTADILYGVGGALLLTGVVLVAVGYSKPKTQRVALTPSFGPAGGSVELQLRF
jgi:tetratricopeptide (TPR) repeat protein